ncbi:MAG: hypothetical protein QME58_14080 [Bacteroidota bacterium]|nr:hypothetical protein [Bacteroidota bacterium]
MLKKSIFIKSTIVNIFSYIFLLFLLIITSCNKGVNNTEDEEWKRNSNLIPLTYPRTVGYGINYNCPVFKPTNDFLYVISNYISGDSIGSLSNGVLLSSVSVFNPQSLIKGDIGFITLSTNGSELVFIDSLKNNISGNLYIFNIQTQIKEPIETGLKAVYSAKFMSGDTTLIIYGEGMTSNLPRGYYFFSRYNNKLKLLFAEPFGYFGFDISPDGKNLIYPQPIKYSIRNLETNTVKTGEVYAEWLAYSPDGEKIVYSDNSLNRYLPSNVGIIDVETGKVTKLDVNLISPKEGGTYASYFSWSSDRKYLAFSVVPIVDAKPLGPNDIWLLKQNKSF